MATTPDIDRGPLAQEADASRPHLQVDGTEVQTFTQLRDMPIGLPAVARAEMARTLNAVLADTRILHDLYKKTHWNMRGPTFIALHELMDKHAGEQDALIDSLAERIQTLGAIAVGDPRHVAELTSIPRPPDGSESVSSMLSRLLQTHESILVSTRKAAEVAGELGDTTSDDLLTSAVGPVNELQVWFVAEHLVDVPLIDIEA